MTNRHDDNPDGEILLTSGDLRARVARFGASLRGLWQVGANGERLDIITGYEGRTQKVGGQGDVLIPFPGRVRGGRYTWDGETYQMPINDKDGPNAIHGFLRTKRWEATSQGEHHIAFTTRLVGADTPGYPFDLEARVSYTLAPEQMMCRFQVTNVGAQDAPLAAGFHPYFTVGSNLIDDDTLHLPFQEYLEFDAALLPTGQVLPVAGTPYDFTAPRVIGPTVFNTCYAVPARDSDGLVRILLTAPDARRALTVVLDETFNYVVLYSGDPLPDSHRRRALAIEPMTCGSDAFNFPDWGLKRLAPGETFGTGWGVALSHVK